jgi:uncharacterized protein (TIGR02453 family)
MPSRTSIIPRETFRFFRDLGKNNRKVWMDANRERYRASVVEPLRRLLEQLAPAVLRLNDRFDVAGRTGTNFSRINRDIRFAKDKTPYKTQMYLKFEAPSPGDRETGQLYAGFSGDTVTAGFRIYSGGKRRDSTIALVATPRAQSNPRWLALQKKRLARKYESYWYTTEKGAWTKHDGWPTEPEAWKKIEAWIVRKKMKPGVAMQAAFPKELEKTFRELYPLIKFTSLPDDEPSYASL